jgi:ribonuclease J
LGQAGRQTLTLKITVHRGTQQIGGSCIELAHPNGERLILDAGRPLDAPRNEKGLLPATLDTRRPATVLFSHPHMDHWGLIDELPMHWPIWSGTKSAELMRLTTELFGSRITAKIETWHSRSRPFTIGSFTVSPFLTDHSGFDAYMLLIEGAGRRILYTGDFRGHGRKSVLVERMMANPPSEIDVLLMEGTNLGSDKPVISERELENKFVELAKATPRHIFVQWSAQNIDRTVTLYRAAKRSGRPLVVDLYAADVLERVASGTRVPRVSPDFAHLKVVITPGGKSIYARQGRTEFTTKMAKCSSATSRATLVNQSAIIMLRDPMLRDFEKAGLGFTSDDAYVFSNWSGYLDQLDPQKPWARAEAAGARTLRLHTSGHASAAMLSTFAKAMSPSHLVPVHGIEWDNPGIPLPPVRRLVDGEPWAVP